MQFHYILQNEKAKLFQEDFYIQSLDFYIRFVSNIINCNIKIQIKLKIIKSCQLHLLFKKVQQSFKSTILLILMPNPHVNKFIQSLIL